MTSDNQLRNEWRSYKCSPEIFETVTIRGRNLQVAPPTIESWKALSEVMGPIRLVSIRMASPLT